jgi:WD40 repeat protein
VQVTACSWSPDGTKVVSCSYDKTVRVWDVSCGECIVILPGHKGMVSICQLESMNGTLRVCGVGFVLFCFVLF